MRGGGGGVGGTRGLSGASLILETWNVGWMHMDLGSFNFTATGLNVLWMGNGPMNFGASLLDSEREILDGEPNFLSNLI